MEDLPQQVSKLAEVAMPAGNAVIGGTIIWTWIGTNQPQITVCIGVIGLCITAWGVWRHTK